MLLFHGSNVIVSEPEIRPSVRRLDFGVGFYTTSNLNQAEKWAEIVAKRKNTGFATLNVYDFDSEKAFKSLSILRFDAPNGDWLDFVVANRTRDSISLPYDVVVGPVANDATMTVINDYVDGRYTKEEAVKRLLPQILTDQFTFVTEKSLAFLKFVESRRLK